MPKTPSPLPATPSLLDPKGRRPRRNLLIWLACGVALASCDAKPQTTASDATVFSWDIGPSVDAKKDVKADAGKDVKPDVDTKDVKDSAEISETTDPDASDSGPVDAGDPCDPNPCSAPHQGVCAGASGVAVCTCDEGFDTKPDGSCSVPCDLSKGPPDPQNIKAGDLVIVEIMIDPVAVDDETGEWFEVRNKSKYDIDLNGLTLTQENEIDSHVIHSCDSLVLPPGGVAVLARSADPAKNGGFKPLYVYEDMAFQNFTDNLILRATYTAKDAVDVDAVKWDNSWPVKDTKGHALALNTTTTTDDANDDPANWCAATEPMAGGDFGTPGVQNPGCPKPADADDDTIPDAADNCPKIANPDQLDNENAGLGDGVGDSCDNCPDKINTDQLDADTDGKGDACDAQVCGDGELDLGESCDDGNTLKNDGCEACLLVSAVPGKVVITELLVHTDQGDDTTWEWFEVYNPGADPVIMNGWTIQLKKGPAGNGAQHVIQTSGNLTVPAKGYLVLGVNDDKKANGNIKVNYVYKSLLFANDGDELTLVDTSNSTVVDKLAYGTTTPAQVPDKTLQLDPLHLSSLENDKKLFWCLGSVKILDAVGDQTGELGTPGAANTSCTPAGQDIDGDTINNELDNCVFTGNVNQIDVDKDGVGDVCDDCSLVADQTQADGDSDGVGDACDNCIHLGNANQTDSNDNGYGDACDSPTCADGKIDAPAETCDDSNKKPGDGCSMNCQKESFAAGAVIVTEALVNPGIVDDTAGEWIEIYNPGDKPVDINGWVLKDDAANKVTILSAKPLLVMPKGYLVLGNNADKTTNGGVNEEFAYSALDFSMQNSSADQIALVWNGVTIDKVAFTPKGGSASDPGFPVIVGKSMQLDPGALDVTKNDDYKNWCEAKSAFGLGDWGSPGQPNPPCINPCEAKPDNTACGVSLVCLGGKCLPAPKCGDGILQITTGEECDDGNTKDGDGCTALCKKEVPPQPDGTLIITEVMPNPDAVPDQKGEWFEVYNPTAKAIDLTGWTIKSAAYTHKMTAGGSFVTDPPTLAPKAYGIIVSMADSVVNNGLKATYAWYDMKSFGGDLSLLTTGQIHVALHNPDGKLIDDVNYGLLPWLAGGSAMLKFECMNPLDNDKPECWVPATCAYGEQIGLGTFDWDTGSCQKDADCTVDPLHKCIPVLKSFVDGKFIYKFDKTGDLKCAVRERGTPGIANVCN